MQSIHPMVVHFPLALLLTAVLLDLAAVALRRPALSAIALWNFCLGAAGAVAAVLSGLQAESVAKHSFEIGQVLEKHERLGFATLALALIITGWRLMKKDRLSPRARAVIIGLSLMMVATLTLGAYLGGRLVYEFGVGATFKHQTHAPGR